jgi:hypothetical protein
MPKEQDSTKPRIHDFIFEDSFTSEEMAEIIISNLEAFNTKLDNFLDGEKHEKEC